MFLQILLTLFSFGLVLFGMLGIFFPFLPGVPLAWLGLFLFAYLTSFALVTWKMLLIFLFFVIMTLFLDVAAPMIGAKKYNASPYGLIGSVLGLFFGLMIFGPIGIVLGPFLGAVSGELLFGKELESALVSAKGTVIGFLAGTAIKLALILMMLGFMIFAALF